jgi:hypothetical protein
VLAFGMTVVRFSSKAWIWATFQYILLFCEGVIYLTFKSI